jgi:hypothetical protein
MVDANAESGSGGQDRPAPRLKGRLTYRSPFPDHRGEDLLFPDVHSPRRRYTTGDSNDLNKNPSDVHKEDT